MKRWTLDELTLTPEERWRFETKAAIWDVINGAYREATGREVADEFWLEGLVDRLLPLVEAARAGAAAEVEQEKP